jgi:hypothetical protein
MLLDIACSGESEVAIPGVGCNPKQSLARGQHSGSIAIQTQWRRSASIFTPADHLYKSTLSTSLYSAHTDTTTTSCLYCHDYFCNPQLHLQLLTSSYIDLPLHLPASSQDARVGLRRTPDAIR